MASGHSSFRPTTANERFKRGYPRSTYIGITAAVAIHFVLFQFSPKLNAADVSDRAAGLTEIPEVWLPRVTVEFPQAPPKVDLPAPYFPIVRPGTPIVADVAIGQPEYFEHVKVPDWQDPRPQEPKSPVYVARDVAPILQNGWEIQQLLAQSYPSPQREAGIGGTVLLWVFVDEQGAPEKSEVMRSSGYSAMDDAALQIVRKMKFTPAQYRKQPVGVWVQQAVTFKVQ
jgi:protein TonB